MPRIFTFAALLVFGLSPLACASRPPPPPAAPPSAIDESWTPKDDLDLNLRTTDDESEANKPKKTKSAADAISARPNTADKPAHAVHPAAGE